ncbi:MORN repeat-containing protein 4-like [Oscarella lobularis]|uniref:MORN repeat-containing protein 4-like n=1 Tax=Oscarella lobularis TaxID=121494 RepID=UPI0033131654
MAGRHKFTYDDGDEYDGEWNADGQRHGFGRLNFSDKSSYVGHFKDGLCHGFGVLSFADGSKYEGEFAEGKFNGYGIFRRADGTKYEGQFQGGKAHGCGLLTFSDGTCGRPRNEGYFEANRVTERRSCRDAVRKAQGAAQTARTQSQI